MSKSSSSEISELIARLSELVESPENQRRGRRQPWVGFAVEEPIAWVSLFGYDVNRFFTDPEFYFEQTLRQMLWRWDQFPDDDTKLSMQICAWLGHYPEYTLVGLDVGFDDRGVPIIQTDHPLTRDPDLKHLRPIDFKTSGWMPRVLRWYEDLSRISDGRLKVFYWMLWMRGCLDLAVQLRGYENFILDTIERPQFVHDLLKFLVEQRCRWHAAYCEHFGVELGPASIADDWINVPFISPEIFADFLLPRYLEIESFHGGIANIHSCGNQTPIQKYLLEIKSLQVLEVSPWTDLRQTLANIPANKRLGINLHPNDVLCSTPLEMETRLRSIKDLCHGRDYSICTSGLSPITDDPRDYVAAIRTWTRIARDVFG